MKKYILFILAAFVAACEPTELDRGDARLTTGDAVEITSSSADLCGGIVTSQYCTVWFELSKNREMNDSWNTSSKTLNSEEHLSQVSLRAEKLSPNTTFYYRICGKYNYGNYSIFAGKGEIRSFTTESYMNPSQNPDGKENGHDYVDLGLPSGLKWATCNVGASRPEEYGSYFAWGETTPKSSYSWSNLKYSLDGNGNKFSKYVYSSSYGTVDNRTTLELSDDAARANWGGRWRMPTYAEFGELISNCTWEWTTQNGVKGYKVTGNKSGYTNKSIFLPAAGYRDDGYPYYAGSYGYYWSSSLYTSYSYSAYVLGFDSGGHIRSFSNRFFGQSVRPVCP